MPVSIHPSAVVDVRAKLAANVTVGAYTVIDGDVERLLGKIGNSPVRTMRIQVP